MDFVSELAYGSLLFGRSFMGLITRPYETYRHIIDRKNVWELVPLGVLCAAYFGIASLVRVEAFRPFLLTAQFVKLALAVACTYIGMTVVLWVSSKLVHGNGAYRSLAVGWGYTLIPTLCWFLITSLLFIVLPPPRTTSVQGVVFSLFYLMFSAIVFFWKVTLAYLTIRFSMRLDMFGIAKVTVIVVPLIVVFSILTYVIGVFRVPFI